MSDLFLPEDVKSAADSVIGDDNPDDGSCFSGVKTCKMSPFIKSSFWQKHAFLADKITFYRSKFW